LGLHVGHDRGAAVVRNGELIGHIALERLDRKKNSMGCDIPYQAIDAILRQLEVSIHDVDRVGVSFDNSNIALFVNDMAEEMRFHYNAPELQVVGIQHHLAHALAAWGTSPFGDCLIFVADGTGDLVNGQFEGESLFQATGDRVALIDRRLQSVLPDSYNLPYLYNARFMPAEYRELSVGIGRKYEQFTYLLGLGLEQHGKTMGLAAYGQSLFDPPKIAPDGLSYALTLADLLEQVEAVRVRSGLSSREFIRRERANIARTVQDFTENALITLLTNIRSRYGRQPLCLSGGVFLNCVANHKLLRTGLFDQVYILPACGDDGHAMGAAFGACMDAANGSRLRCSEAFPYIGLSHSEAEIASALTSFGLTARRLADPELASHVAKRLAGGAVVGLVRGRTEVGPRALCHRSILLDPRRPDGKDYLNEHVKFRESYRPYAPVVTAEAQFQFFDLLAPSPFMLLACDVREEYRSKLPAITHVDGTARIQAVEQANEPFIHRLLTEFERCAGVPVLLNTSFNLAGEPIVETPTDAIRTFLRTRIDVLVLEEYVVEKDQLGAATQ
jgi:carbamoyltransferase